MDEAIANIKLWPTLCELEVMAHWWIYHGLSELEDGDVHSKVLVHRRVFFSFGDLILWLFWIPLIRSDKWEIWTKNHDENHLGIQQWLWKVDEKWLASYDDDLPFWKTVILHSHAKLAEGRWAEGDKHGPYIAHAKQCVYWIWHRFSIGLMDPCNKKCEIGTVLAGLGGWLPQSNPKYLYSYIDS